jgi:hypothetical protein
MSRYYSTLRPLLLLALAASAVGGCMAEEPTTTQKGTVPDKALPDFSTPPDMAPAGPVAPPVIGGLAQTSMYNTYPLSGQATPGYTVLISGTAVGEVSAEVDPTGKFCALVQLTPNALTTMSLVAVNPEGTMSTAVSFSVTQSGSPPQQGNPNPSVNAALDGMGTSSVSFADGDESLMHDGDPTSYADMRWSGWSSSDWIQLTLPSPQLIKQIQIMATSACPLTAPFSMFISDSTPSASPGPGVEGWTLATPAPMAMDATDVQWNASFATPPTVQSIAIYWDHGWAPTGTEENCGSSFILLGPLYAISEIQAWTVAGTAPPPVGAPSCGG